MANNNQSEEWRLFKEEGNLHVKEGRFEDAIISYSKGIQNKHTHPVLYSNRAIAELKLKKYNYACQDVECAIALAKLHNNVVENSDMIKYYRIFSEALVGSKQFKEALEVCENGLTLDPQDTVLLTRSSHIQNRLSKKPSLADSIFFVSTVTTRVHPEMLPKLVERIKQGSITAVRMYNGFRMSEMASEMLDKNEYDHAMFLFKQSNIECGRSFFFDPDLIWNALDKCTPNNPDAMLIKACLSMSDLPNAAAFTEQSIRTFPHDAHLHRILACIYRFLHEYEKALHEIEKAIELDPSHKRWLCIKAMCLHFIQDEINGGKRDEAIECYKEYLVSNPSDDNKVPTVLYCIANLYMFKEDVDNVCLYWEKATEAEKNRLECFEMLGETKFEFKDEIADYLRQLLLMCGACERLKPKFKCACKEEAYCDRNCQMGSWRAHKKICKAKK